MTLYAQAVEHASEDQLRALVFWQAKQIHRLTGGIDLEPPDLDAIDEDEDPPETPRSTFALVEAALAAEDIFRKPARVAAPRLIERLASEGIYLTTWEQAS